MQTVIKDEMPEQSIDSDTSSGLLRDMEMEEYELSSADREPYGKSGLEVYNEMSGPCSDDELSSGEAGTSVTSGLVQGIELSQHLTPDNEDVFGSSYESTMFLNKVSEALNMDEDEFNKSLDDLANTPFPYDNASQKTAVDESHAPPAPKQLELATRKEACPPRKSLLGLDAYLSDSSSDEEPTHEDSSNVMPNCGNGTTTSPMTSSTSSSSPHGLKRSKRVVNLPVKYRRSYVFDTPK